MWSCSELLGITQNPWSPSVDGTPEEVTQAVNQVVARTKDNAVWATDGSASPDFTVATYAVVFFVGGVENWD